MVSLVFKVGGRYDSNALVLNYVRVEQPDFFEGKRVLSKMIPFFAEEAKERYPGSIHPLEFQNVVNPHVLHLDHYGKEIRIAKTGDSVYRVLAAPKGIQVQLRGPKVVIRAMPHPKIYCSMSTSRTPLRSEAYLLRR